MTTLAAFQDATRAEPLKPDMVVMVRPEDFADECERRPKSPIMVGLRRLSETSEQGALIEAAKRVSKQFPDGGDPDDMAAYANESLLCVVLGRAVCDPNDVERPCQAFELAEDRIADDLNPRGLRKLWADYERLCIEATPLQSELTNQQISELCDDILDDLDRLHELGPVRERRVRRLLGFVADELAELLEAVA